MQLSKKKMPNLTQFTQKKKKKKNVFLKMVLETVALKILLHLQTNTREWRSLLLSKLQYIEPQFFWERRSSKWQWIYTGMDEIYEMHQTYQKFYTQLGKGLIIFFFLY